MRSIWSKAGQEQGLLQRCRAHRRRSLCQLCHSASKAIGKGACQFRGECAVCTSSLVVQDTESAAVGDAVRSALLPSLRLDLLPKASIDVFITVLQVGVSRGKAEGEDDEACAAAAATVASCALADAGIEMWGLVVGVNGVLGGQDKIVVDALHSEVEQAGSDAIPPAMTLWSMPALGTVTAMEQWGDMSIEQVERMMDALQSAAVALHYTVASALKDSFLAREARTAL